MRRRPRQPGRAGSSAPSSGSPRALRVSRSTPLHIPAPGFSCTFSWAVPDFPADLRITTNPRRTLARAAPEEGRIIPHRVYTLWQTPTQPMSDVIDSDGFRANVGIILMRGGGDAF